MNYPSTTLRELRESQGLLIRQVTAQIDRSGEPVDTALMSKLERGESGSPMRRAQREHIIKIATVLNANEKDLIVLWLADRIKDVIQAVPRKDEPLADKALELIRNKEK